jgi:hypothetical protein
MSLQAKLWLLNTKWHEGTSKAKQYEGVILEKELYAGHCSSIYREDEPPLYKITITPLKALLSLFTNAIGILPYFPFLYTYCAFSIVLHPRPLSLRLATSTRIFVACVHR